MAAASTVLIRGSVDRDTLPGLDIGTVHAVQALDIFEGDINIEVWHIGILAHRPNSHTNGLVTGYVFDEKIGSISLGSNAAITIGDSRVLDEKHVAIPGVIANCIGRIPLIIARSINKEVGDRNVFALPDEGCPELRLDDRQMVCQYIRRIEESNADWTSRLIGIIPVLGVPGLSIPIVPASPTA